MTSDHSQEGRPPANRKRPTPWWYAGVAAAIFLVALAVHLGNASTNAACTVSEDSSSAVIHDTPECTSAFHTGDVTRWLMIVSGVFAVALPARRILLES